MDTRTPTTAIFKYALKEETATHGLNKLNYNGSAKHPKLMQKSREKR